MPATWVLINLRLTYHTSGFKLNSTMRSYAICNYVPKALLMSVALILKVIFQSNKLEKHKLKYTGTNSIQSVPVLPFPGISYLFK